MSAEHGFAGKLDGGRSAAMAHAQMEQPEVSRIRKSTATWQRKRARLRTRFSCTSGT